MQSATCSSSPMDWAAMVLMPMMAFMGVRISWLMRENSLSWIGLLCSHQPPGEHLLLALWRGDWGGTSVRAPPHPLPFHLMLI